MKKILFFIGFIFSMNSSFANDLIHIYSFKDTSCGAWFKSEEIPEYKFQYDYWFRGFVSGYNYNNKDYEIANMPDLDTFSLYVNKYCRENPLNPVFSAAIQFIKETKTKRIK
jgi:hypothetical protein